MLVGRVKNVDEDVIVTSIDLKVNEDIITILVPIGLYTPIKKELTHDRVIGIRGHIERPGENHCLVADKIMFWEKLSEDWLSGGVNYVWSEN